MRKMYRACICCGRHVLLMCETEFCSGRCRDGKCKHNPR